MTASGGEHGEAAIETELAARAAKRRARPHERRMN